MTTDIRRIAVLGTGVLGSQIAYQCAFHGFEVNAYDVDQQAVDAGKGRLATLVDVYRNEVAGGAEHAEEALARITVTDDFAAAVGKVDLVIEAVPEVAEIKQRTYQRLAATAPAEAIFATNTSTMLPSDLAGYTGRPDRFLALHFANRIWRMNTAEIMGTAETDPEVFERVVEFAKAIGMIPIVLHKEKGGYVLNSLLVPFLDAAAGLAAGGYAEPETVDTTWKVATGAPLGPFEIFDVIGLNTPYNLLVHGSEEDQRIAAWLKANYIDKGHLGVASGEGFYRYPRR